MKTLVNILFLTILTGLSAYTQPTLNSNIDSLLGQTEMYTLRFQPEAKFIHPSDNIGGLFDYGDKVVTDIAGSLKTWVLTSETVHGNLFPEATIATTQENQARETFYTIDQDSNFVELGRYLQDINGNDAFQFYQDPKTISQSTNTWGTSYIDTSMSFTTVESDTTHYHYYHTHKMIGYGDVETPEDFYENCLIKEIKTVNSDGKEFNDNYIFYHKNLNNIVLEIVLRGEPADEILLFNYKSKSNVGPTNTIDQEQLQRISKVSISQNELLFNASEDSDVSVLIFNQSGQKVFNKAIQVNASGNVIQVPTQLFDQVYFVIFSYPDHSFETFQVYSEK